MHYILHEHFGMRKLLARRIIDQKHEGANISKLNLKLFRKHRVEYLASLRNSLLNMGTLLTAKNESTVKIVGCGIGKCTKESKNCFLSRKSYGHWFLWCPWCNLYWQFKLSPQTRSQCSKFIHLPTLFGKNTTISYLTLQVLSTNFEANQTSWQGICRASIRHRKIA